MLLAFLSGFAQETHFLGYNGHLGGKKIHFFCLLVGEECLPLTNRKNYYFITKAYKLTSNSNKKKNEDSRDCHQR